MRSLGEAVEEPRSVEDAAVEEEEARKQPHRPQKSLTRSWIRTAKSVSLFRRINFAQKNKKEEFRRVGTWNG